MDRSKEHNVKRTQLENSDQAGSQRQAYGRRQRETHSPFKKYIPLLFIAVIGILIARQEIPAFRDWWQMTFSPDSWSAQNTCRQAVIDNSGRGKYLRVLEPGEVHDTSDGPYVEGLVVMELGANGFEQRVEYTCYLDKQGSIFKLNRKPGGNRKESVEAGN